MNDDQTVALGAFCEALMRDETFNVLCSIYKQNAFEAMMASAPHETKTREAVYHDVWGLQNFLGMMQGYVNQKDQIIADAQAQPEQDD